ncbi:MAG: hypothetical protein D3919_07520 [Candidatus Electrothrix sp. AW5]|nr:hypothetical protein [Candidatus Electrothrix gigas]
MQYYCRALQKSIPEKRGADSRMPLWLCRLNRESLVKFPILHRVINKLGSLIDDASLQTLLQQTAGGDVETVAKDFLKAKNLI